jgi:hypothetical protein
MLPKPAKLSSAKAGWPKNGKLAQMPSTKYFIVIVTRRPHEAAVNFIVLYLLPLGQ